ncbi:MAG: SRPBCC family protein [Natronomonas sp.]
MQTYTREVRVSAPLESVWSFHSNIDGLEALTPGFLGLEVVSVTGPDGEPNPTVLEAGSRIEMQMRPLGVLPGGRWVSVITDREYGDGSAMFRDVMEEGPFPAWTHTHRFFADGEETLIVDRVEYELPGGRVGEAAGPLGRVGFEPMFRYRHSQTKKLLESA